MTSAEYLERYHEAMNDVDGRYADRDEWYERRKWITELREAYLLMREVEERGEAKTFAAHQEGRIDEPEATKPTGPYLELTPCDPVKTHSAAINPGDVYEDTNGDICVWAPRCDERSREYSSCCWFDPESDKAVSTEQYHEEITVIGRLKAVYPNKGG